MCLNLLIYIILPIYIPPGHAIQTLSKDHFLRSGYLKFPLKTRNSFFYDHYIFSLYCCKWCEKVKEHIFCILRKFKNLCADPYVAWKNTVLKSIQIMCTLRLFQTLEIIVVKETLETGIFINKQYSYCQFVKNQLVLKVRRAVFCFCLCK